MLYHSNGSVVLTASSDASIRVWDVQSQTTKTVIKVSSSPLLCPSVQYHLPSPLGPTQAHDGAVSGISLHPTGDYVLSSSMDEKWVFSDIRSGRVISQGYDANNANSSGLTCSQFHPDGLIFGTGTVSSVVKIWDLKERTNVANFSGHSGTIVSIAFSENG